MRKHEIFHFHFFSQFTLLILDYACGIQPRRDHPSKMTCWQENLFIPGIPWKWATRPFHDSRIWGNTRERPGFEGQATCMCEPNSVAKLVGSEEKGIYCSEMNSRTLDLSLCVRILDGSSNTVQVMRPRLLDPRFILWIHLQFSEPGGYTFSFKLRKYSGITAVHDFFLLHSLLFQKSENNMYVQHHEKLHSTGLYHTYVYNGLNDISPRCSGLHVRLS